MNGVQRSGKFKQERRFKVGRDPQQPGLVEVMLLPRIAQQESPLDRHQDLLAADCSLSFLDAFV
jgi:hypothetical protein